MVLLTTGNSVLFFLQVFRAKISSSWNLLRQYLQLKKYVQWAWFHSWSSWLFLRTSFRWWAARLILSHSNIGSRNNGGSALTWDVPTSRIFCAVRLTSGIQSNNFHSFSSLELSWYYFLDSVGESHGGRLDRRSQGIATSTDGAC
jgi:hypothetical protein